MTLFCITLEIQRLADVIWTIKNIPVKRWHSLKSNVLNLSNELTWESDSLNDMIDFISNFYNLEL